MSRRKKVNRFSSDEDDNFQPSDDFSTDDSDSDFVYEEKKKSDKNSKKSKSDRPLSRSSSSSLKKVKKRTMSGTLTMANAPKSFPDIPETDLTHNPAGKPVRFVSMDEIGENILNAEAYFQENEIGINTFLPGFQSGNPNHLGYFGFTSNLQKTELVKIIKFNEEQLQEELEKTTKELNIIPETKNPTTIAIPGFSTNLHDAIAINCDVRYFDWKKFGQNQKFDVILMDPPWLIAKLVTRGVNIEYAQLITSDIENMPLQYVQDNGFLFMWVIAARLMDGIKMMRNWGYNVIQTINWVKVSRTGRYMPSNGYYFQHNKETLLVGLKGNMPEGTNTQAFSSLIVAQREVRQSQKPEDIYKIIEEMCPGMMYLEVFARPHNLREGWVSMGIELPT